MALIGEMKYLQIGSNTYEIPTSELPIASSSTLGGIKVGTNLSIDSSTGVLSVTGIPSISITRNLTSGTKSATINVDGTDYDIYSKSGTVTSIGLTNATNGGLTISGSPVTSSGSITVGHTNVLTSAQTTQAVYPIKIDKNGHISAYGSAVSIPTKTSDLTNDSGFITDAGVTSFNGDTGAITYTAPVTSVNGNTGAVTLDVDKWNGVSLANQVGLNTGDTTYVVTLGTATSLGSAASKYPVTRIPTAHYIPKYDDNAYLLSTTPSANDNSTKVATTAFVASAVSGISIPTASSTTPAMDGTANVGSETTFARGDHVHPTDTSRAASTSVTTQATIDNTGLITYKNSGNTSLYTVQLPLFDGGSGASDLPFLPLAGGSLTGNLNVGGTTTSTGLLTASGGISTTNLTASGNTTVGGTLSVSGATILGSTLGVTGATILNNTLNVTGMATVGGALDVDGSATFDSGVTISGVLDVTPRRCEATLSSPGWYRVLKTVDAPGEVFKFEICRTGLSSDNETHTIDYHMDYGGKNYFVNETSVSGNLYIDKIRCNYDSSYAYIDIHYNTTTSCKVYVHFSAEGVCNVNLNTVSIGFSNVGTSPSGETVLTEYSFAANTAGAALLTAITSRGTITSGEAVYVGRMVHLNFIFTASTTADNSPQIASAPSALYDSALSCIDITDGMSSSIANSIPCGIGTTGRIFIQSITNGHIYAITGNYLV